VEPVFNVLGNLFDGLMDSPAEIALFCSQCGRVDLSRLPYKFEAVAYQPPDAVKKAEGTIDSLIAPVQIFSGGAANREKSRAVSAP